MKSSIFNKTYEKTKGIIIKIDNYKFVRDFKNTIKENYKSYLIIIFAYIILCIKLPYTIYSKGGLIPLTDRIEVDSLNNKEEGSLNLTYVTAREGRVITVLIALINPNWDIVKNGDITISDETIDEMYEKDRLYMIESDNNAIIAAYTNTGNNIEITDVKNTILYIDKNAKTALKENDVLLFVDNVYVDSLETYASYIKTKLVGETVSLKIKRNEKDMTVKAKVIEIDGQSNTGISFVSLYDLNTSPKVNVHNETNESGPSGGLMVALEIYNKLTTYDITKGRIIAGTGTIDDKGNVGAIGGIKYKVLGAIKNDAEIFISPKENCDEAKEVIKDKDSNIKLICVSSLSEAIYELS